jgi:hypothetical protein
MIDNIPGQLGNAKFISRNKMYFMILCNGLRNLMTRTRRLIPRSNGVYKVDHNENIPA